MDKRTCAIVGHDQTDSTINDSTISNEDSHNSETETEQTTNRPAATEQTQQPPTTTADTEQTQQETNTPTANEQTHEDDIGTTRDNETTDLHPDQDPITYGRKQCPHCKKFYVIRFLAQHIRNAHVQAPSENGQKMNYSVCIDQERGLFAVVRNQKGPQHFVHVTRNTKGASHRVECELQECHDITNTNLLSGLPGYMCKHIRAAQYCKMHGNHREPSSESLKRMEEVGAVSRKRCDELEKYAQMCAEKTIPMLVEVPQSEATSKR